MKSYLPSLPVIALILAGCDPVSERECDVFDHPDLAQWQADTTEATVRYMSTDGTIMDFNRQAPVLNMPFIGSDGSSNDEDVICELSARIRLLATDNTLALTSIYEQQEQLLLESEDEALLINHLVEAPAGTELVGSFLADISDDRTRFNINPLLVIYLDADVDSEEIGGQSYEDVIRVNTFDPSPGSAVEPGKAIDHIKQIVVAREFGIVAFTDVDDREFVRVPIE
ncbi:MAG: hypothetical protein AB8B64_06320 [Granulosicoccus sp.]